MKQTSLTPNKKLAHHLCVYFKDKAVIKQAVIISKLESDFQNVTSSSGLDYGFFQVSEGSIKAYKLDKNYLMQNWFYQFHTFERIMKDKLRQCKHKDLPEACWHSKTPVHYNRYKQKYKQILQQIQGVL